MIDARPCFAELRLYGSRAALRAASRPYRPLGGRACGPRGPVPTADGLAATASTATWPNIKFAFAALAAVSREIMHPCSGSVRIRTGFLMALSSRFRSL